MTVALVASTKSNAVSAVPQTTPNVNTTGATLLVAQVTAITATSTFSDSKGNTWSDLTQQQVGNLRGKLVYVNSAAPTVGSGHNFTPVGVNMYQGCTVLAFSGTDTSPFDQQSGGTNGFGQTVQPGSITPSANNYVLVSGLGQEIAAGPRLISGGGFSVVQEDAPFSSGNSAGSAISYAVQTTAAASNPTWDVTGSATILANIASFKAAAAAGGAAGVGLTQSVLLNKRRLAA